MVPRNTVVLPAAEHRAMLCGAFFPKKKTLKVCLPRCAVRVFGFYRAYNSKDGRHVIYSWRTEGATKKRRSRKSKGCISCISRGIGSPILRRSCVAHALTSPREKKQGGWLHDPILATGPVCPCHTILGSPTSGNSRELSSSSSSSKLHMLPPPVAGTSALAAPPPPPPAPPLPPPLPLPSSPPPPPTCLNARRYALLLLLAVDGGLRHGGRLRVRPGLPALGELVRPRLVLLLALLRRLLFAHCEVRRQG